MTAEEVVRLRCTVTGAVQGVGFRPYVCGTARELGVVGFVGNNAAGAFLEVQGLRDPVEALLQALRRCPPPARVRDIQREELPPGDETSFEITTSVEAGTTVEVPPDVAICNECLRDLHSPGNRRFEYPFTSCARCGPRYTLICDVPFDRANTSMAAFKLCPVCAAEYRDARDRRFHAQTISCPACGPVVRFLPGRGQPASEGRDAIAAARAALAAGGIVAVKGDGGFHLACDATNNDAVRRLRSGKLRGEKPFALMAARLDLIRAYADVDDAEEAAITSPERPIVLLSRCSPSAAPPLSPLVSPGVKTLGFMLPFAPLHHLLLGDRPLVMTSGNASGEPILTTNEAAESLRSPADALLVHDRAILAPCDDSVVRVIVGAVYPIRRSRGFAPRPIPLRENGPTVLAVGGELKAAACLTVGTRAFLTPHIGDVGSIETRAAFETAVERMLRLTRSNPEIVACDAHPDAVLTRWAEDFARRIGRPLVRVPHHRAHVAALAAEHHVTDPIIGLCLDGTGYGDDRTIWGGEIFAGPPFNLKRVAHLSAVPLPGGEACVHRPYRMSLAHLHAADVPWDDALPCVRACPPAERAVLQAQLPTAVTTTSAGRLFDAVASLIGIRHEVSYEAQAALELEACAIETPDGYNIPVRPGDPLRLDPAPMIRQVAADAIAGVPVALIAGRFHRGLAASLVRACEHLRAESGMNAVGLTGGVFQNALLLSLTMRFLREAGFTVLIHRQVPTNDGGLSLGQAVLARGSCERG